MIDAIVTVKRDGALYVAKAHWHGLRWVAVGDTRDEAIAKARSAAASGVWKGRPMAEAPGYVS